MVAPRITIPILANILVEAQEDGTIIFTATDLSIAIRCTGKAKVLEPGATTIPARRSAQLFRELKVPHVELFANEKDVMQVTAGDSTFRLHGLSTNEFPSIPDVSTAFKLLLKQSELKDMLFRTSFAVSKEDSRYALTGVYLQCSNGVAVFVGTDGKRLARSYLPVSAAVETPLECILPLKAIDEIARNLRDNEDVVLYIMPDKIAVEANDTFILTKLLSGDYPDVDRVIPSASQWVVPMHREELMMLLRQVCPFVGSESATSSVKCTLQDAMLHLTADSIGVGEGKVSMPVNYSGPRFDIAFNPLSLLQVLQHNKNEVVSFGLTDSYNPIVIADGELEAVHKEFPSPLFVLMPLRLG